MHHALYIEDIVHDIFSYLRIGLDPSANPETEVVRSLQLKRPKFSPKFSNLAALARTCSTLAGPALDWLWHATSLVDLLRCLPSDLWAVDEESRMCFLRPIEASDLDRVRVYAPRIKHLISDDTHCVLSKILPMLAAVLPDKIFERLTGSVTPELRQLVSTFVQKAVGLETLQAPVLDQSAITHLASLPNLKSLGLTDLPLSPPFFPIRGVPTFPMLRQLNFGYCFIGPATEFFRLCHALPLASLNIQLPYLVDDTETPKFFAALHNSCLRPRLTALTILINCKLIVDTTDNTYFIHGDVLRPLFGFGNLRSVLIRTPYGFNFDNPLVDDLARSWPRIESLELLTQYPNWLPPATIACLTSFARHCPALWKLGITFNAWKVPADLQSTVVQPVHRSLKYLNVEFSKVDVTRPVSLARVSRFILVLFPELREISPMRYIPPWQYPDRPGESQVWKKMNSLLRIRQKARDIS
ncbi:hypothetical protein C8R43DRAFT_1200479 [Mycena crocata]|nr:hypothetical protein C8R43DRAFT_1200479 [Mycena crocata]